jgi:hypothetical protein
VKGFLSLPATDFPNPEELSFSAGTFYNRVFTVGQILHRPRNLYHQWKEEKLIPEHFGRDFWWQFQDLIAIEELEDKGWDKLNFVEACWVILVDILRTHGYPKKQIALDAQFYFKVSPERREFFQGILQRGKEHHRESFKALYNQYGEAYARDDFNKAYREVAASVTFGTFDSLLLSAVYNRSPLSFIASHSGRLIPFLADDPLTKEQGELIEETLAGPHIIIPFYKRIEELLFDPKFTHFSSPITKLNEAETELIKALRDKRIREVNVKKSNQDEWTIRQRESGTIDISDERSLFRLLKSKDYKRVEFTAVNGNKKFFEAESIKKRKVE